jgi:transposase
VAQVIEIAPSFEGYFHPTKKVFVPSSMDLTDEQWEAIRASIPEPERQGTTGRGGRPWKDPRDVLNGILWILRTGAPWADMPLRYPPYQTCHDRFRSGSARASWTGFLPRWPKTFGSAASWT